MKILMLGWEFPPNISGGLGVASKGFAEALATKEHEVTFLLPKKNKSQISQRIKLVDASSLEPDVDLWKKKKVYTETLTETSIGTLLMPYLEPEVFERTVQKSVTLLESTDESKLLQNIKLSGTYTANLSAEILKYAMLAVQVAISTKPDVVHAHDWITFRAAVLIKKTLGLPIILHVHSTEHDRNGIYAQQHVLEEEKTGLEMADHIISVSQRLKQTIMGAYGICSEKITVIPNVLEIPPSRFKKKKPKHIAFVGRLTHQKGPSMFIDLARDLYSKGHKYNFTIIGDGYLRSDLENRVASSHFAKSIRFTGFLDRSELLQQLSNIDLLVVPSASEPFGLVALEAILKGIPVAATRGIGLGEFVPSLPQVERWDHFSYVKLIERLMTDAAYRSEVIDSCQSEAAKLTNGKASELAEPIYQSLTQEVLNN